MGMSTDLTRRDFASVTGGAALGITTAPEWSDGFANRFGLVHVDDETQKRTPKLSAAYFREAVARNAVV